MAVASRSWGFYFDTISRLLPDAEPAQYSYFRVVEAHFRPGMKWLDAGCGHTLVPTWMRGASQLEERFLAEADSIVGCDVDQISLAKPSKIKRVKGDLRDLPFRSESFDFVTCNVVAEHLRDPARAFAEFFRVLRRGGVAIVHTPNVWHPSNLISRFSPFWFHKLVRCKTGTEDPADVFPTLYRSNTRARLGANLQRAGFQGIEISMFNSRPQLVGFGPLLYLECLLYRLTRIFPGFREMMCAVAWKPEKPATRRAGK